MWPIKLCINSKSCTTFTTDVKNVRHLQHHKLQERVHREKIGTVEELQQCIMDEWECLDLRVIDNAVKQWRKCHHARVAANSGHFWHLLWMSYNFCLQCWVLVSHKLMSWSQMARLVILVSADIMSRRLWPPTCQDWVADLSACITAWCWMCMQQALIVWWLCCQRVLQDGAACRQHTGGTVCLLSYDVAHWAAVDGKRDRSHYWSLSDADIEAGCW